MKGSWSVDDVGLPAVVPQRGLTAKQQWYLYNQVRPFCPAEDMDFVCLLRSLPNPGGSRQASPNPEDEFVDPPTSNKREQGIICHESGMKNARVLNLNSHSDCTVNLFSYTNTRSFHTLATLSLSASCHPLNPLSIMLFVYLTTCDYLASVYLI